MTSLPHVPFARHRALDALARQQVRALRAPLGLVDKTTDETGPAEHPVGAAVEGLNLNLVGVVDAVEDSTLMRFGSYAVAAGGAVVFIPVAAVLIVGCVGVYAGLWGVRQMTKLGASSARKVWGLPDASVPVGPQSTGHGLAERHLSVDVWPTQPYMDDEEDF